MIVGMGMREPRSRRRRFLRAAAAWSTLLLPGASLLRAQERRGVAHSIDIRFLSDIGVKYRMVESVMSTFERTPENASETSDRGGLYRHEYDVEVVGHTSDDAAHVRVQALRGNGASWGHDRLVLYDSADEEQPYAPAEFAKEGEKLVEYGRHRRETRLSQRAEPMIMWNALADPPVWVPARNTPLTSDIHRLFLQLPPAPIRRGDAYRTWMMVDHDPINSGAFDNDEPIPVGVRFEGTVDDVARFSLRGGIRHNRYERRYLRAIRVPGVFKWIARIELEGVVDIDIATGWVRAREQTVRVHYRRTTMAADGKGTKYEIVNTRRLVVTGERLT